MRESLKMKESNGGSGEHEKRTIPTSSVRGVRTYKYRSEEHA